MSELSFKILADAWKRMLVDPTKVSAMQVQAPSLANPTAIRLKNETIGTSGDIHIKFYGFDAATDSVDGIPIVKRLILNWLKQISDTVQVMASTSTDLNLLISTRGKFTEAAVPIYHRDPKTNKVKRVYKCLGGRKNGRRVSNPDQCLQVPSIAKKIKLSISKRTKHGQVNKARAKTRLTNIVSKKVRKANVRLKKSRGF